MKTDQERQEERKNKDNAKWRETQVIGKVEREKSVYKILNKSQEDTDNYLAGKMVQLERQNESLKIFLIIVSICALVQLFI